jgi:CRISPR-associated endonuclease/helicase Cas3
MPKPKRYRRFNFGRIFFPGEASPVPSIIRFQPLGDHVGNVKRLVKQWKEFPNVEGSKERVIKAADLHDMGKPQRFSIQVNTTSAGKFKNYIYSFRGHRFLAENADLWAQTLARGHHDFSVGDISRDTYKLRKESQTYADWLSQDTLAYAHELYILEMCDQIEAELACRVIGDEEQAESRTFMDYTISKAKDAEQTYLIDPWAFHGEEIKIKFRYWSKTLSESEQNQLQALCDRREDKKLGESLDLIVKTWWQAQESDPPVDYCQITLKPLSQKYLEPLNSQAIYQRLAGYTPNPMQDAMYQAITANEHPAILLKGPTGAGKTEAILFPVLNKGHRLILPLPAKSLLEDQKERVESYLLKFSQFPENQDRELSLVVDTGSQMYRWVYKNGQDITKDLGIKPRRHLYKGDVILTTLDKFLYRYFSFGDKQKSFVFPFRINRSNTLICFDEAHSYDEVSFTNFQSLVQALYEAGRSLVLMTATMPGQLLNRFDYLEKFDFVDDVKCAETLNQFQEKTLKYPYANQRQFEWISDLQQDQENLQAFQQVFAQQILQEWEQSGSSCRILAVVETVRDAAEIYQQLKAQLAADTQSEERYLFLYHGRIADKLRPELYRKIKQRDDARESYILVTTSAIEVGCDLNAELLISQICPPENLIQRAGRCNRKGDVQNAKVIVIGNRIPDFVNSLDETEWKKYQEILQSLKTFDAKAIGKCIARTQQIDDYRVIELFSMLHDYVYNADLTCQPTYEKGLVVTRSWTPSATLFYDDGKHEDWSRDLSELPQISIPLDRLIKRSDESNLYASVDVYERYYDQEQTRRRERPLTWGSAYQKDILIRIGESDGMQPENSYEYDPELGFVQLPGVFTKWRSKEAEQKLEYKPTKTSKSAVISYIKPLNLELLVEQTIAPS